MAAPRSAAVANLAKAWLLVAVVSAAFGGLGWLIGGRTTALLFVLCSLLAATGVYRYGDRALLGMLGARPYAVAEGPILRSTVDKVAARLGVRPPALYLIPDGFPRLFAVGRGPRSSALAVSTGALQTLRPEELEAALAHELAHVRRRDVLVQTSVVLFATNLVELSRVGGWFSRALLFVFAPIAAAFVHLLLSSKRETAADELGAAASRDANDLADALLRLDRAAELVEFAASPATEPLYPFDPFEEDGLARMFKTHPPLDARVRRLRELGAGPNGRPSVSSVDELTR
jgi:heat shock protein HtpX